MDQDIKMGAKSFKGILDLHQGYIIDEEQIFELNLFVNNRLDCADFRIVTIIRTHFCYRDLNSVNLIQVVRNTIQQNS